MTEINFYVSQQDGFEHRLNIVYKLIGYALKRNLFTHIHTDNEIISKKVDDMLWEKEKTSFITHQILNKQEVKEERNVINEAVTISHDHEPMANCDYLINLSIERPSYFSRFSKMAEIIDNSEDILTAGRKRYVFYRERGYTLAYHKL